jgi:hypothetical protein
MSQELELVFLVEGQSEKIFIETLWPHLCLTEVKHTVLVFEGKSDLDRKLDRRITHYRNTQAGFIVLRDQDASDCYKVKAALLKAYPTADQRPFKIRIACRELESWLLGDLKALFGAYGESQKYPAYSDKAKYRDPDRLSNPGTEIAKMVPSFKKTDAARRVAMQMNIEENRSKSFKHFVAAIHSVSKSLVGGAPC